MTNNYGKKKMDKKEVDYMYQIKTAGFVKTWEEFYKGACYER
jgi:hypothetical protein